MSGQDPEILEASDEPINVANENTPLIKRVDSLYIPQLILSWKNLSFTVFKDEKSIPIIQKMSGVAMPREIIAVMGTSGSGKTTLINLLAGQYFPQEQVSGEILVNGNNIKDVEYNRMSAYVMQNDILLSTLTPREALRFSLDMKLVLPEDRKEKRVNDVLNELRIERIADNTIGGIYDRGISGGERKRLCIGVELITNPSILFLDEPLSGLDSFKANEVVEILRHQADKGKTILMSIHQPSMKAFNMVDKLILVCEGRQVYGGRREEALDYFEGLGFGCKENIMPPDHFINVLFIQNRNEKTEEEEKTFSLLVNSHKDEEQNINESIAEVNQEAPTNWKKFGYLFIRTAKSTKRNVNMSGLKMIQTLFITVFLDMIFFDLGRDIGDDQNINGALFLVSLSQIMISYQNSTLAFQVERSIVFKEKGQGLYDVFLYYICKIIVDIPFMVISSAILSLGTYWIVGFNDDSASKFFNFCNLYTVFGVMLCQFAGIGFGYFASALFRNTQFAVIAAPLVLGFLLLYAGFFTNPSSQPEWSAWIKYFSPFYYGYSLLTINEYTDCQGEVCVTDPLDGLDLSGVDLWEMFLGILLLSVGIRIITYFVLAFKKR